VVDYQEKINLSQRLLALSFIIILLLFQTVINAEEEIKSLNREFLQLLLNYLRSPLLHTYLLLRLSAVIHVCG